MSESSTTSLVRNHVIEKVLVLQRQYVRINAAPTSFAQATLAKLRQNRLDDVSANPRTWEYLFDDLPDELRGHGEKPSHAEAAIHETTTLYAIHQQGRSAPMHEKGRTFGQAVRSLAVRRRASDGSLDAGTLSRFQQLCVARSSAMRLKHLRTLVALLRGEEIPLDYGLLAGNLFHLHFPHHRQHVLLAWGRDFHSSSTKDTDEATTTNPQETA